MYVPRHGKILDTSRFVLDNHNNYMWPLICLFNLFKTRRIAYFYTYCSTFYMQFLYSRESEMQSLIKPCNLKAAREYNNIDPCTCKPNTLPNSLHL